MGSLLPDDEGEAMFVLRIETENAAFQEGLLRHELHHILLKVIQQVDAGFDGRMILDSYGNRVGGWEILDRETIDNI